MYKKLADFYDEIVGIDYDEFIRIIKSAIPKGSRVLDIACGTGKVISLLKDEYNMLGSDISEEMLIYARGYNPEIPLFIQDMREDFALDGLDAIICTVDSINYILEKQQIEKFIFNVASNLNQGIFIFDSHTTSKLNTLKDYLEVDVDKDFTYIWKVDVNKDLINHYLTMFVYEEGYQRFDEEHTQRVYTEDYYESVLKKYFEFEKKYMKDRVVYICKRA